MLAAPLAASPAGATPAPNGCKASTTPGAEMGHYPAFPASQSGLRIACVFDSSTGSSQASGKFTIHDFAVAQYHNGSARSITNTAALAASATTFTATNCTGMTAYVNRPISAVVNNALVAGTPSRAFVKSISGACLVTLNKPVPGAVASGVTWKVDNTIGRSVVDGATTSASTTVTSATANFTAADVGLSVGGTNIVSGTLVSSVTNATTIVLDTAAIATGTGQTLTFGGSLLNSTTRQANDATNTSATVINSPAANWKTDDIGLKVTGPGIPANTFILSIAGANATTSGGLTITVTPGAVVIGEPSNTAPADGTQVLNQGVSLDLNPTLVAGSEACSADNPEGFSIVGQWENPGSFVTGAFSTQPASTKAIGQIKFATSVITFAAFVIERKLFTPGDPIGSIHYDIVIPNAPTLLALCPSATSPGFGYSIGVHATSAGVASLPSGVGKPGSAQFRSILPSATGGYLSTVYIVSDDPAITFSPAGEFNRLCIFPDPSLTYTVNFTCGDG